MTHRQNMNQPNILYIHSHDTGRYIQPYGYAVPTPHLQHLAGQGVLFRQCFCAAPTCSPSRAALLTGQCAHSSGMIGLAHRGFALHDYGQHVVHTLRQAGYHSMLVGTQHIAADAAQIGYDRFVAQRGSAEERVRAAVDFLGDAPPQPFFLSVGFTETHRPFPAPGPEEDARYCLPPHPLPDTPRTRQDMAAFQASARVLDRSMGAVLQALEANGLAENTLVVCTTDHGIAFPGMKCNLTDHGIGVMLIVRGPGGFAGGQVCEAMVSHVDILPTICDLLQIAPPPWLQGTSMRPLIRGQVDQIHDAIYAEVTYHAAYEPQRCVRTPRWKYIRRFDGGRFDGRSTPVASTAVLPNCDDSPSKDVWLEHGWPARPVAAEQLYDLAFDPNEACNLAGDPSTRDVLAGMRSRLERWMQETDDPLLRGPVPAPPGARVNDPDGLSPNEQTRVVP